MWKVIATIGLCIMHVNSFLIACPKEAPCYVFTQKCPVKYEPFHAFPFEPEPIVDNRTYLF